MKINERCRAYTEMDRKWRVTRALRGGTEAMREAGREFLHQFPKEDDRTYEARLKCSYLFNGYSDAVRRLVSKPFQKPVEIVGIDDLPAEMQALKKNADGCGRSITRLAREVFESAIDFGLSHVFVDVAAGPQSNPRPYFIHIPADRLIWWETQRSAQGLKRLSLVRWIEMREEVVDGKLKTVEYVREVTTRDWALFREKDGKFQPVPLVIGGRELDRVPHSFGAERDPFTGEILTFATDDGGRIMRDDEGRRFPDPDGATAGGEIPLATMYTNQTGFMTAEPPLLDLADENLRHWNIQSDTDKYARFARVGGHFFAGMSAKEFQAMMGTWAAGMSGHSQDSKVTHFPVEAQGRAFEVGRVQLQDSESRMRMLGAQPLTERLSGPSETAQGKRLNEARHQSDLHAWVGECNDMLTSAGRMAARWRDEEDQLPEEFNIRAFSEFQTLAGDYEGLRLLLESRNGIRPVVSDQTIFRRFQQYGILPETLDPEAEQALIRQEMLVDQGIVD